MCSVAPELRSQKFFRFIFCGIFVLQWVALDFWSMKISLEGLSTPWYPQAALSLALFLAFGWRYFWLVPLAKIISSMVVWPGPLLERILPTLIFATGIAAMGLFIRKLRDGPERSLLVTGGLSALIIAAVDIPMVALRNIYYFLVSPGSISTWTDVLRVSFENWLGDCVSIFCLTLVFEMLLSQSLSHSLAIIRKILKSHWPSFVLLLLLAAVLPRTPEGLGYRFGYVLIFPCLVVAAATGMEGALIISFFANVIFGISAASLLPRVNAVELQVFFLSLNGLIFFLGALVTERKAQIAALSEASRKVMETQFVKVRVLLGVKAKVLEPLFSLLAEAEQANAAGDFAISAQALKKQIEQFQIRMQGYETATNAIENVAIRDVVKDLSRELANCQSAGIVPPEFEVHDHVPEEIQCEKDQLRQILEQLAMLLLQTQAKHRRKRITLESKGRFLRICAAIVSPGQSFSSSQLEFVDARNPIAAKLPAGGYALTVFLLNSLVRRSPAASLRIYPDLIRLRETMYVEILLPLNQPTGTHHER